jgi:hypothetical protein
MTGDSFAKKTGADQSISALTGAGYSSGKSYFVKLNILVKSPMAGWFPGT